MKQIRIPIDILFSIGYFVPVKLLDIHNPICENTSAVKYKDRLLYNRIIDCIIPYIVSCKKGCHILQMSDRMNNSFCDYLYMRRFHIFLYVVCKNEHKLVLQENIDNVIVQVNKTKIKEHKKKR